MSETEKFNRQKSASRAHLNVTLEGGGLGRRGASLFCVFASIIGEAVTCINKQRKKKNPTENNKVGYQDEACC